MAYMALFSDPACWRAKQSSCAAAVRMNGSCEFGPSDDAAIRGAFDFPHYSRRQTVSVLGKTVAVI